jgi:hypothetical protein
MKKFMFIMLIAVLGIAVNAQYTYQSVANDTVKGATAKYVYSPKFGYLGSAAYDFTEVNRQTDTTLTILEGGDASGVWVAVDTVIHKVQTTATNLRLEHYPATFLYYRIRKPGSVNDTTRYSNQLWVFKKW